MTSSPVQAATVFSFITPSAKSEMSVGRSDVPANGFSPSISHSIPTFDDAGLGRPDLENLRE
jgi:hypothetical protein